MLMGRHDSFGGASHPIDFFDLLNSIEICRVDQKVGARCSILNDVGKVILEEGHGDDLDTTVKELVSLLRLSKLAMRVDTALAYSRDLAVVPLAAQT
eukprot:CAMPEP_0185622566 /NCGR_PEP_ID=MMETSP0436-20130131/59313_1 /TAXON_ID=626734 ORGANISM="Favella taraikaensis, Strain Fe Narragansett Bay" /NCGR_SAMPLE_ID=MMETSP0436 /ASSEMBLY_ACC=CAM_ASM_000390 /LENGTH=96 /DNA_ID=CAMNT_0028264349 /DNA_START=896 /DNA_END=1183 /DNA_ORIENTATION=+